MMTKDHGPGVKNDKHYEGLREKDMSEERAAKIAAELVQSPVNLRVVGA